MIRPGRLTREGSSPAERRSLALGVGVAVIGCVVITFMVSMSLTEAGLPDEPSEMIGSFGLTAATLAFLLSGALIISRQPKNVVGWLLVVPGLLAPASDVIGVWLVGLDPVPATATPSVWLGIWVTGWAWILLIFPIFLILLTFPDGRLLSPRWRWAPILLGLMTVTLLLVSALAREMEFTVDDNVVMWSVSLGFSMSCSA